MSGHDVTSHFFVGRATPEKVARLLVTLYQLFWGRWELWAPAVSVYKGVEYLMNTPFPQNPWGHRNRLSLFKALEEEDACEVQHEDGRSAEVRLTPLAVYLGYYGFTETSALPRQANGTALPLWQNLDDFEPCIREYTQTFCEDEAVASFLNQATLW